MGGFDGGDGLSVGLGFFVLSRGFVRSRVCAVKELCAQGVCLWLRCCAVSSSGRLFACGCLETKGRSVFRHVCVLSIASFLSA